MSNVAKFVLRAHSLEELQSGLDPTNDKPYVIAKEIELGKTEYDNFITDFCVTRWFIEENTHFCGTDKTDVWHCLLVKEKGQPGGVLVMPHGSEFPKWTAICPA